MPFSNIRVEQKSREVVLNRSELRSIVISGKSEWQVNETIIYGGDAGRKQLRQLFFSGRARQACRPRRGFAQRLGGSNNLFLHFVNGSVTMEVSFFILTGFKFMDTRITPATKYSYREYQLFPDNGMRHEIVDGDHYMSPAPSTKHQTVSRRIQFQLYTQIELKGLGQVFNAPTDVELAPHDIAQPDILVVLQRNARMVSTKRIRGVPDLIIEILSDSNPDHDRVLKLEMYQRVGVPEYWIVDPEEEFVEAYVLAEGRLKLVDTHRESIQISTMSGFDVDLNQVWGK